MPCLTGCGQSAVAARGGGLHAHRGPQTGTLGIVAGAGLGNALQRDRHVLVGGQRLVDQRGQRRIAVAGPPGAGIEGGWARAAGPACAKALAAVPMAPAAA